MISVGLAFGASLLSFWLRLPRHLKVFSILLGLTLFVETSALLAINVYHFKTNLPLYNIFMLVEFFTYAWYFKQTIHFPKIQKIITIFLQVFPFFWAITTFAFFGIAGWNSYVIILGSFFTVCMCVVYYYQLLNEPNLFGLSRHSEFWIVTGMLIYYTCSLPCTGMLYFLDANDWSLADKLVDIMDALDCIMYLLFTYAFLCRINIRK